jgi:predicted component of type VI protein secretion system
MKKTITKYFTISLLLVLLSLVFIGCSSAKKYKQENTLLKSEIQKRDSLKSVIINQAIDDKLITLETNPELLAIKFLLTSIQ